MRVSIVLTTYNSPEWLEKVLWGYAAQTVQDFELVVADDGSTDDTRRLLHAVGRRAGLTIRHVWHEHRGFRKCRILNRAVEQAEGHYLIFSDGDCIPRHDFVATHVRHAEPGCFLSGGLVRLSLELSRRISVDDVLDGRATQLAWLARQGLPLSRKWLLMAAQGGWAALLDRLTPTRPTWNGHNASGWKRDILRVNGFDERMAYGGLDRELGERLVNAGVRPKQIRHRAVCVHLDHPRAYLDPEAIKRNRRIRRQTRRQRLTWTPYGIRRRDAGVYSFPEPPAPASVEPAGRDLRRAA